MTSNQIKLIAMVLMTIDHVGMMLFPHNMLIRIIGRLSYPLFAYMIAEGCVHTKNKRNYLLTVAGFALVCQIVYFVAMGSLYMCILVTFSLSISIIFAIDFAQKRKTALAWCAAVLTFAAIFFITYVIPRKFPVRDFAFDGDFIGVLVPVFIYLGKSKWQKLGLAALALCIMSYVYGGIQWYCLLAVPLLALYNGRRGEWKMKYLFYFYYPLHLVAIYFLSFIV